MAEHGAFDEEKILLLLSQGSEYAFTQLFDHYRGRIYGVAMKFLHDQELSEEVVQEVFLKVWNRREGIIEVRNFSGYLFVTARNLVFDYIKRLSEEAAAKREFGLDFTSSVENESENLLIEAQFEELLHKVVERLPSQQKQVFRLARIEGLSHEDIAKQMNISRLTVKRHMATALKTIRFRLKNHLSPIALLAAVTKAIEGL